MGSTLLLLYSDNLEKMKKRIERFTEEIHFPSKLSFMRDSTVRIILGNSAAALSENVVMILGIVLFLLPILWEQRKRFYEGKVKKGQPVNQQ